MCVKLLESDCIIVRFCGFSSLFWAGNIKILIWARSRPMLKISMLPNPIVGSGCAVAHYWIWKHTNFQHWSRPRPISVYYKNANVIQNVTQSHTTQNVLRGPKSFSNVLKCPHKVLRCHQKVIERFSKGPLFFNKDEG